MYSVCYNRLYAILCLASRTTTDVSAYSEEVAYYRVPNMCVFSRVQKKNPVIDA